MLSNNEVLKKNDTNNMSSDKSDVENTNALTDKLEGGCDNSNIGCKNNEEENYELSILSYPWRRFFARTLDIALYSLIWDIITGLGFNWNIENISVIGVVNSFAPLVIMIFVEPLLLSKYGTTLGKLVFGLVIRDMEGGKLTYAQGLHRTFLLFRKGLCYNIPLFNLLILINCYEDCKADKILPWEKELIYIIKDRKIIRIIAFVCIYILILGISFLVTLRAEMPINIGELTPVEYYENCNDMMAQLNRDYGRHLNQKGEWIENKKQPEADYLRKQPLSKYQLTVTDGIVSGVRIEIETDNDFLTFGFLDQKDVIVMSFFAAQSKMNCLKLKESEVLNKVSNRFENYTFIQDGIRVSNEVELRGYEVKDNWIKHTGHEHYIHMIFEMEKV